MPYGSIYLTRQSVAGSRQEGRGASGDDSFPLWYFHSDLTDRLPGHTGPSLGRLRADRRRAVLRQLRTYHLGCGVECVGMVLFSLVSLGWCLARVVSPLVDVVSVPPGWRAVHLGIGLCRWLSNSECHNSWIDLVRLTQAWHAGVSLMVEQLIELISKGDFNSVFVGVGGLLGVTFFGWLLKLPLQKQAIRNEERRAENDRFKAIVSGLEDLASSQREEIQQLRGEISRLRASERVRDEYEDVLIREIREARSQQLPGGRA